MGRKRNKKDDDETHLPSWMDESYDEKHKAETEPLLFGGAGTTGGEGGSGNDIENNNGGREDALQTPPSETTPLFHDTPSEEEEEKPKHSPTSKRARPTMAPKLGGSISKPHMPHQNPCLWMFHFLNGSAVVAALCIILTQILPLLLKQRSEFAGLFSILNMFLKFYIVLFCVLFILVETDVPISLLRNSALLQAFWSRGFLYSFLGLISTVEAYSDKVELYLHGGRVQPQETISWSGIFMQVSAWILLAIGVVYMLLGLCCMKRIRDRMKEQEQHAWQTYRQHLREWKSRREIFGQDLP